MTWQQIVDKFIGYVFILAILYLCSQTILQWNDTRRTEMVKEELRKEFEVNERELQKQIIRLEILLNDSVVSSKYRMDTLEKEIIKLNNMGDK